MLTGLVGCIGHGTGDTALVPDKETGNGVVVRKRDNGTTSSVNPVDEMNRVHGVRVTFYANGRTIYSRTTFSHGIKNGPAVRYYRNGQVFEHSGYLDGKKHGPVRKYYMDGTLMAEFECEQGVVLPGLKEYTRDGTLVTSYPEIRFTEEDHLDTHRRIDLVLSCSAKGRGVKYYLLEDSLEFRDRIYLISENGSALMQYYLKPGESIDSAIAIVAEIPTELGNVYVTAQKYHLQVTNNSP